MDLSTKSVDEEFNKLVYSKPWFEPVPAADGGEPSMLASPVVLLGFVGGLAFWAGVGWFAFFR